MSSTLYRLGHWASRSPWKVISTWIVILILMTAGAVTFSKGLDDAFSIPGTESQEGLDTLATRFPQVAGTSGQYIFVSQDGRPITDHKAEISEAMAKAGKVSGVETALDPFNTDMPGEISDDGTAVIASIQLDPALKAVPAETVAGLEKIADANTNSSLHTYIGGQVLQKPDMGVSIMEILGVVAALVILAIVFRAFRSAFIPIVTAITGIAISMIMMMIGTSIFTISSSSPTLALMLGLAVGIDYSLFIVSRHLDQLREGIEPKESISRAIATSGSAVIFAGLTVVIALVGLSITGIPFIAVMGFVSAIAVACNVLAALTLLPAFLGLFGEKIRPKKQRAKTDKAASAHANKSTKPGILEKWVRAAIKFPIVTVLVTVLGLGALAIPFKDLQLALPDQGTNDRGSYAREAYDIVTEKFGPGHNATIIVTADIINTTDPLGVMDSLKHKVLAIDGVDTVQLATPNSGADLGIVVLRPKDGPTSESTKNVVHELRDQASSWEKELGISDIKITGATAIQIDIAEQLNRALLPFAIFVVGLSLVLLAAVFRSVWVPIKAALGFLLSIGAAFGITSMVFTYGWGAQFFHIKSTGPVIAFLPIMAMGVLFGLAMDYEVFLVTRMREEYMHSKDPIAAIVSGFKASAPVVIAAAAIMIFIFAGFVPESAYMIQPIAFSLGVGIFIDAFIVRMTLVPAVLALLGRHAWTFPAWLDRLLPHLDVEGEGLGVALEHRQWVQAHGKAAIRLKDVTLTTSAGEAIGPLSGAITPGSVTLVRASDAASRHALLNLFAARLEPQEGALFINDRQVPGETGAAQASVEFVHRSTERLLAFEPHGKDDRIIVAESLSDLANDPETSRTAIAHATRAGATILIGEDAAAESFVDELADVTDLSVLDLDHISAAGAHTAMETTR